MVSGEGGIKTVRSRSPSLFNMHMDVIVRRENAIYVGTRFEVDVN